MRKVTRGRQCWEVTRGRQCWEVTRGRQCWEVPSIVIQKAINNVL